MTVIHGIEIDDIRTIRNDIKAAIDNNGPIEERLNVIIVVSNPCQYARRYILAREFVRRIENHVNLFIVELAHDRKRFQVTEANNPRHLQIRTDTAPLWHKENLINIGVKKLLPADWRAFAWVDADIEFENTTWANDALKVLNGSRDVVQLWSHAIDLDSKENTMNIFESFGYKYTKDRTFGKSMWHPGFAWAITRDAYERVGGLFEVSILGSGDHNMAMSLIGKGIQSVNANQSDGYRACIDKFCQKAASLRLGYVPGVIRHYFHGSKKNRQYSERWKILADNEFDPSIHLKKNAVGLLVPTDVCPPAMLKGIVKYFEERNEDEKVSQN